jgi:hypothetical protein
MILRLLPAVIARSASDEAIHASTWAGMDCFAALAMTGNNDQRHSELSVRNDDNR